MTQKKCETGGDKFTLIYFLSANKLINFGTHAITRGELRQIDKFFVSYIISIKEKIPWQQTARMVWICVDKMIKMLCLLNISAMHAGEAQGLLNVEISFHFSSTFVNQPFSLTIRINTKNIVAQREQRRSEWNSTINFLHVMRERR
jgi:hypothetical protein